MSVTFTERKALEEYIDYIKEERVRQEARHAEQMDKLMDEYKSTIQRLSKLDEIDNVHPVQAEVVNQVQVTPAEDIVKLIEEPSTEEEEPVVEEVKPNTQEIQKMKKESLEEAVERFNKRFFEPLKKEVDPEPINYSHAKELTKDQEYKKSLKKGERKSTRRDVQTIAQEIMLFLKEIGRPAKSAEIFTHLKSKGYKLSSPYALLYQAKNYNPKIQSASFGYYQYKF